MPFSTLPEPLAAALSARGYEAPTAVQAAVLTPDAEGRDLLVSAQTGSGKTVAFGLAIARDLLDAEDKMPRAGAPLALVIAPTRELALQVARELLWLYGPTGARIVSCVGGMDAARERRNLSHGAHIVVGTPGRLRDHLERGALDLSGLKVAILDEADEMLDMGFREDLEGILDGTPAERRTLLFSATLAKPIVALAKRYQKDAFRIDTREAERGHGDISYQAMTVAPNDIENAVVNLLRLHEPDTAFLFCATREAVRHLHANLVERGFDAVALSGEHSQSERNHALQALRDRRARVCVATDVAARGIDLPSLSLVVHVELPRDAEALQHRSGRTGRAGKKGIAALIVPFQRRRRVEGLLRDAKINAEWIGVPTPEQIHAADRERLLAKLAEPVEFDEADVELGARLLAEKTPEDIAALLVRAYRAKLPAPEELSAGGMPERRERQEGPRPGFEDTVWFRMNVGRRHNADPRWLLPLLCRRGHITKGEIGAIRIANDESAFEIPKAIAGKFIASVKRTAMPDDDLMFEQMSGPPAAPQRRTNGAPPRHSAKPYRGGRRG
ncbi:MULTISPECIES: DEAD/DEAH box helicase [Sphingomonas]|jgi:ATP-dependent RNA helicase DeaD|uniref:DEAD/DEAH box helicase n=1 Tax=Sphingomonas TaxID=13687 RepID=UPI000DBC3A36|nr:MULTISPECIES: DEAD/DEAH box helicase [Sphingomonas]PZT93112.1 MAG: DEAD/DEAH box helicase [Sphingomonas sp.]RSV20186.1 ATP-dependent helicase [Sphingomonas sp. ABOLH]WCP73288.1 DEAD/DEAH box helicase [Sphingomonas hankookensis]